MKWRVRFYKKQIYHTTIEAATREEAEAALLSSMEDHAGEINCMYGEDAVIGISPESEAA